MLYSIFSALLITACTSQYTETDKKGVDTIEKKVMAYARFVPERNDDLAWENDKVAFRIYGPAAPLKGHSNGVDAWFKKIDYSIIEKWYDNHLNKNKSYHVDHGEGYDVYHTGISRGVGGSAIWINDTPYAAHSFKKYEIIENDGDKVVFNVTYEWFTPLGIVKEDKTISLEIGSQLYQVDSTFTLDDKLASLPIAIGIATHDGKASVFEDKNTGKIAAWEMINGLGVGTGAIIKPSKVKAIKHIESDAKDESHIWLITSSDEQGKLSYKAGFAWEGAGDITTTQSWLDYLNNHNR